MKLDDICFPAMTLRDLLRLVFKDDWNSRRTCLENSPGIMFNANLYISQNNVPMALAREVLKELMAEEALTARAALGDKNG